MLDCGHRYNRFEKIKNVKIENNSNFLISESMTIKFLCFQKCSNNFNCGFLTFQNGLCRLYNLNALTVSQTGSFVYKKEISILTSIISSYPNQYNINSGTWGPYEMCDESDYVTGFRTRVEPPQGLLDDTAMNGIELICKNGKSIKSSYEQRGDWNSTFSYCPNNEKVKGFIYGMESKGNGDDTAMNVIRLICNNDATITSSEGVWSSSFVQLICPFGVITGLRTQVESYIGIYLLQDDTCLNNIEFICKTV